MAGALKVSVKITGIIFIVLVVLILVQFGPFIYDTLFNDVTENPKYNRGLSQSSIFIVKEDLNLVVGENKTSVLWSHSDFQKALKTASYLEQYLKGNVKEGTILQFSRVTLNPGWNASSYPAYYAKIMDGEFKGEKDVSIGKLISFYEGTVDGSKADLSSKYLELVTNP